MLTLPGIQTKINTQVLPAYMYVRPDHRVVTRKTSKGVSVIFGTYLPLSEGAAKKYARRLGSSSEYGVKLRSRAVNEGLLKF